MDHLLKTRKNVLTIRDNASEKYIVFSDFHRGVSDKADDFRDQNKKSYTRALSHYFNQGYKLIHLGDVEELKEQFLMNGVVNHKPNNAILRLEKTFYQKNRYIKVFGNHDSQWENKKDVRKYLDKHFPKIKVYEGVFIEFTDAPDIMLVHGHQGYSWFKTNIAETIALPFYKLALNFLNISRKVNYDSYCKIEKAENEFYEWTKDQEDLILVFGHTHRPLWGSSTHIDNLEKKLDVKRKNLQDLAIVNNVSVRELVLNSTLYNIGPLVNSIRSLMNKIQEKMNESGVCRSPLPLPILFNTGCCIYEDGDITGIEIENGEMRLIKWGKDIGEDIVRKVLESGSLDSFTLPS